MKLSFRLMFAGLLAACVGGGGGGGQTPPAMDPPQDPPKHEPVKVTALPWSGTPVPNATGGGVEGTGGGADSATGGGTDVGGAGGGTVSGTGGGTVDGAGGGTVTGTGGGSAGGTATSRSLYVRGNHIYNPDGTIWHGRGANLHDMRGCNACTGSPPNVAEVKRRIDLLVDGWKANFIRLNLESYGSSGGYRASSNYQSLLYDAQYLADIREIVRYIGTKPGVQVLVSLWHDPSIDGQGRPTLNATTGTDATWKKLAQALADQPHAMFGIINEPQNNFDGASDATVWSLMNSVVKAIRDAEDAAAVPYHIVTVQGTGGWARRLNYYVTHPITERGGKNVAYEIHVYNPSSSFVSLFENFAATLPIIIGEYGPMSGSMSIADSLVLMDRAQALEIPHLAWTFHMRCAPDMLVDNSGGGCGAGMPLQPSSWGNLFKARLAQSW